MTSTSTSHFLFEQPYRHLEIHPRTQAYTHVGVSKNSGFPLKSSILIKFSIIFTIHFGGFTTILGNTHVFTKFSTHEKNLLRPP